MGMMGDGEMAGRTEAGTRFLWVFVGLSCFPAWLLLLYATAFGAWRSVVSASFGPARFLFLFVAKKEKLPAAPNTDPVHKNCTEQPIRHPYVQVPLQPLYPPHSLPFSL
jgi:hypothetical protein